MDDLKALLIGIIGGLAVLGISKAYRAFKRKTLRDDIEFLEYEKNHLAEMKRSSVEMNRSSFRGIFAVLSVAGVAEFLPSFLSFAGGGTFMKFGEIISAILWLVVALVAFRLWRRYDNLKNFKEATEKMEQRLESLRSKYDGS